MSVASADSASEAGKTEKSETHSVTSETLLASCKAVIQHLDTLKSEVRTLAKGIRTHALEEKRAVRKSAKEAKTLQAKLAKRDSSGGKKKTARVGPKRPPTPFLSWMGTQREKLQAELNTKHSSVIAKHAGGLWKAMSDAEKAPFEDAYQAKLSVWRKEVAAAKEASEAAGEGGATAAPVGGAKRPREPAATSSQVSTGDDTASSSGESDGEEEEAVSSPKVERKSSKSSKKHKKARADSVDSE
ncbi:HMGB4 [Symbiodinium sp. KB8]|nr:HMGB4 [Symbiodinium sp. KB8]